MVWVTVLDNLRHPRFLRSCEEVSASGSGNAFVRTCGPLGGTAFIMESFDCLDTELDKYFFTIQAEEATSSCKVGLL